MKYFVKKIGHWVLPNVCIFCEHVTERLNICNICEEQLPWLKDCCYHCGLPLFAEVEAIYCSKCLSVELSFDRLCGLFFYQQPIVGLITLLKFKQVLYPGKFFGHLLSTAVAENWYRAQILPEVLIPVPLHSKRLRHRGYNQSYEILRVISKQLGIPIDNKICQRKVYTKAQASLNAYQRKRNLKLAFSIDTKITYRYVAIVDDVVTTGSTVQALSEVLREHGVEDIDVWCICRA